jgi:flavin-dependent dehydrogenase
MVRRTLSGASSDGKVDSAQYYREVALMAKSSPQLDVLVLGQHPCAYLAAEMLCSKPAALNVAHATIPGDDPPERLVLINPQLFALHKPLEKARKKLRMTAVWGTVFLADDGQTRGEWQTKSTTTPAAMVATYGELRKAFAAVAKEAGAKMIAPKALNVRHVDEKGFEIALDHQVVHPKAVLLAGVVSSEDARALALPEMFSADVMRRYSFLCLRGTKWADVQEKPLLAMSLDVGGKLTWAWMLPGPDGEVQLAVEQPLEEVARVLPASLMRKWAATLLAHKFLKSDALPIDQIQWIDIPAAGALSREIIGNRTLLFGPAGGFYTACLEDLYPNCWSATFAVEAVRAALQQPHLQDALQPYRQSWGTTLGEYLRGPQQNLRFLLPLVYRNPVMTARLAESILQGKSVVR